MIQDQYIIILENKVAMLEEENDRLCWTIRQMEELVEDNVILC